MGVVAVPIIIAAAGAAAKGASSAMIMGKQTEVLRTRLAQERLQNTEQNRMRDEQVSKVLSAQTAQEAARGISPSSASFSAIQQDTFDKFSEDRQARSLQLAFSSASIKQQEDNIRRTLIGAAWGNPLAAIQLIGAKNVSAVGTAIGGAMSKGGAGASASGTAAQTGTGTELARLPGDPATTQRRSLLF